MKEVGSAVSLSVIVMMNEFLSYHLLRDIAFTSPRVMSVDYLSNESNMTSLRVGQILYSTVGL